METHKIIGLALMVAGVAEPYLGRFLAQRTEDEKTKLILKTSLTLSGLFLMLLGLAIFWQLIPIG